MGEDETGQISDLLLRYGAASSCWRAARGRAAGLGEGAAGVLADLIAGEAATAEALAARRGGCGAAAAALLDELEARRLVRRGRAEPSTGLARFVPTARGRALLAPPQGAPQIATTDAGTVGRFIAALVEATDRLPEAGEGPALTG